MTEDASKSGDRPTHKRDEEVEITPAMIAAGVSVFYDLPDMLGPGAEELRQAVRRCFIAMRRASPKGHCAVDGHVLEGF